MMHIYIVSVAGCRLYVNKRLIVVIWVKHGWESTSVARFHPQGQFMTEAGTEINGGQMSTSNHVPFHSNFVDDGYCD